MKAMKIPGKRDARKRLSLTCNYLSIKIFQVKLQVNLPVSFRADFRTDFRTDFQMDFRTDFRTNFQLDLWTDLRTNFHESPIGNYGSPLRWLLFKFSL